MPVLEAMTTADWIIVGVFHTINMFVWGWMTNTTIRKDRAERDDTAPIFTLVYFSATLLAYWGLIVALVAG